MSHLDNHRKLRVGKMPAWQRRASYLLLGACFLSGLIWFLLADLFALMPPDLKPWWLIHGASSLISLIIIGSALPHHILVTWRFHRNRVVGLLSSLVLLGLLISAVLLFYGTETVHDAVRWIHIALGVAILILFPWHIVHGKKSVARVVQNHVHNQVQDHIETTTMDRPRD